MSTARYSIVGAYNFDDTIFDNMTLPEGIEKQDLIDNILLQGAPFELLYSDLDFLKYIIGSWSRKHYRTFEKWQQALTIKYEPLNNYDRTEDWLTSDRINDSTDVATDHQNTNVARDNTSSTTENKRSAYNSSTYQPDEQNTTATDADSVHNTKMTGNDNTKYSRNGQQLRRGRAYGNIGVTTSQQMLESELEIDRWNIIEHITDLWLEEFVIPVY